MQVIGFFSGRFLKNNILEGWGGGCKTFLKSGGKGHLGRVWVMGHPEATLLSAEGL